MRMHGNLIQVSVFVTRQAPPPGTCGDIPQTAQSGVGLASVRIRGAMGWAPRRRWPTVR
jgi:hypothetical protein